MERKRKRKRWRNRSLVSIVQFRRFNGKERYCLSFNGSKCSVWTHTASICQNVFVNPINHLWVITHDHEHWTERKAERNNSQSKWNKEKENEIWMTDFMSCFFLALKQLQFRDTSITTMKMLFRIMNLQHLSVRRNHVLDSFRSLLQFQVTC